MQATSFALIAHDLKNALGSLEGELESLIDDPSPAMAHSAYVRCAALRRQFVQFLTVYGAGEGMRALCEDESPKDVLELVYRAGQTRHLSMANSPRVDMQVAQHAPSFWYFDQRLVHMALDAAFHNASRFAQSQITLSLRADSGHLVFVIDDDGPGLGAVDPSSHSTGLGTKLCQAVAQAHHSGDKKGRVELKNRPDQQGARFELWLP
jgi:signal transduction histidine kinase